MASNLIDRASPETPVRSRPAAWLGLVGGLVGATCCVGPAVGLAMGAGTGSLLLAMGGYRLQAFLVGAALALAVGWWFVRGRRRSCPTEEAYRSMRSRWLDVGLVVFALTYALGRFALPPLIERF